MFLAWLQSLRFGPIIHYQSFIAAPYKKDFVLDRGPVYQMQKPESNVHLSFQWLPGQSASELTHPDSLS